MTSLTKKACVWALALILVTANAQAAASSGPDFNATCDDVLALEDGIKQAGQNAWTVGQQKLAYCIAARDSKKAASSNGLLSKVWAGVAGVCTTACVASFFSFGGANLICTGSNIGAGVTDAVVTKEFSSALTTIGTTLAARKFLGDGTSKVEGATKQTGGNWAACMSAGVATFTSFNKSKVASQAKETMNGNLASAATLGAVTSVAGPTQTQLAGTPTNVTNNVVNNNQRVTGGTGLSSEEDKKVQASCDGAESSGDTAKITSCAMMADSTLPKWVAGGPFNSELQKATGTDLGGFVRGSGSNTGNAIGMASGLRGDAANKLGELLAATEKAVGTGPAAEETMYAGGGGAPAAGGGEEAPVPDFAAAMAKLMGKGEKDEKGDPQNVKFSGKPGIPSWLRGPASEDDRNFSLFDRVTYRYYFVGRRIIFDEEATPGDKN